MSIYFIEEAGERRYEDGKEIFPVYMVKDKRKYFVFNRTTPAARWEHEEYKRRKQQLIENDGAYVRLVGGFYDPLEMLATMARGKHHFTDPDNLYRGGLEKYGFLDFHGNRVEITASFFFRIYDRELASKIWAAAEHIKREEWDKAQSLTETPAPTADPKAFCDNFDWSAFNKRGGETE